jgi:hypothetical protein
MSTTPAETQAVTPAAPVQAPATTTRRKSTAKSAAAPAAPTNVTALDKPHAKKKVPPRQTAAPAPTPVDSAAESAAKADKPAKQKKPKLVRDSFTMPKAEYAVLDALKQRALALGRPVKKTELLRASIQNLATLSDESFVAALQAVPVIKTGRPAKA